MPVKVHFSVAGQHGRSAGLLDLKAIDIRIFPLQDLQAAMDAAAASSGLQSVFGETSLEWADKPSNAEGICFWPEMHRYVTK